MRNTVKLLLVIPLLMMFTVAGAQNIFWKEISESSARTANQKRTIIPERYKVWALDSTSLLAALRTAPAEFSTTSRVSPLIMAIPMPDGSIGHFNVVESSIMEPGLAALFPEIKTYSGQGIDDRTATIKMDWTAFGFHAMILSPLSGSVWIDPYAAETKINYISYYRKDLTPRGLNEIGVIEAGGGRTVNPDGQAAVPASGPCLGATLRTYRLAVACTGEYAVAVGGTTAALLHSAIVTSVNRVNGVYEKELAVRLVLIANNNLIEFLLPGTDPFTANDNGAALLNESQTVIGNTIGAANYDIGHTFSTGGGGIAQLGSVCGASKARGVTGLPTPIGDAYDIDFVAHEMGHQFGGQHTFNAITGNCSGNASATSNAEPGSGSTIMAYAGICLTNDLQPNSDPQFHPVSFNQLGIFTRTNGGSTCGVATSTGNTRPVVNAGSNYTIPVSTPFTLTGSATDVNGDLLTYSWDEIDVGGPFGNWNAPAGAAPLFRSFPPTLSPKRTFPKISDIANNVTTIGEILPNYARDVNFRLTARDNRSGGGGVCFSQITVTTAGLAAFNVTSQAVATNWVANGSNTATITWAVAGTTVAPFNSPNVSILFSTDGGLTFPFTLLASTANDGTESIVIPAASTTKGRVMVKSIGNIFFDINIANITVTSACQAEGAIISPVTTVVALAGAPSLNLGLSPQYATPLTISGSITSTDPVSSLALFNTVTSSCAAFGGNVVRYDVFTFTPSISATYTFTLTGANGTAINLYSNSFNPANPCLNFLRSNLSYNGTTASTSTGYSQALTAGATYSLAVTTFDPTFPTLPNPYSVAVVSAPAGGVLFAGTSFYANPGVAFNYAYVIVNTTTGVVSGISATANLTNSVTYPAGTYAVYGLSYATAITNLNTYVGGNISALTSNIFTNPSGFCANFSKNLVTVIITSPLPVNFLGLTARRDGRRSVLNWKTASEQNSDYFNVQRSADGINFTGNIGAVDAAGNSSTISNYNFSDQSPLSNWNYYRVEEVAVDGSKSISNIAAVSFDATGNMLIVYPNPASDRLNIEYTGSGGGNLSIQIIDSKGALVKIQKMQVAAGRTVTAVNVAALATGIYILKYVEPDGHASHLKFIKK